ncbi:MAG: hypothetical protein KY462_14305 [Actinobacteria bacterium]|nr:hypothetical protein [Actinomycetota bacterium]
MRSLEAELEALRGVFPGAHIETVAGIGRVCVVPDVATGKAWEPPTTEIRFLIAQGYPQSKPDCFFSRPDLRLKSGATPQNARPQRIGSSEYLWFSWHLRTWNPAADDLTRFARFCNGRLQMDR